MKLDDALIWYREGHFTAADVTRATGLSERSQRELLKIGVLQAVPQAKTKTRLLYSRMVKRAAVVAPLNRHGLSLKVAGKIVYAAIMIEDLMFDIIDPIQQIFEASGDWDPITKLPPKRENPDKHGWFDPNTPARAEEGDHLIEIINNHYVSVYSGSDQPIIFGELTSDGTDLIVWYGSVWDEIIEPRPPRDDNMDVGTQFWAPYSLAPHLRQYQSKKPTEADKEKADFAWRNPIAKVQVNADLTLRVALRRLLYIDPAPEGVQPQSLVDEYAEGGGLTGRIARGARLK